MGSDEHVYSYRCIAASVEGFIQQVAVSYIRTGHFFYVRGIIPMDADTAAVDAKIIAKYGIDITRWGRALRKQRGEANMQYIRLHGDFVIMATHGRGLFFELEGEQVQDCRRRPIKVGGYSLSYRGGHPHVRIDLEDYLAFKAEMTVNALRLSRVELESVLSVPRFVPYAPVRRQLWNVWREVNRVRAAAGLELITQECLPLRRRIVRPFAEPTALLRGVSPEPEPAGASFPGGDTATDQHDLSTTVPVPVPLGSEALISGDDAFGSLAGPVEFGGQRQAEVSEKTGPGTLDKCVQSDLVRKPDAGE